MDSRPEADMMRFIDTSADGSELDLSEDGVSSVASSADLNFDLNSLGDAQSMEFGWMDDSQMMNFDNTNPTSIECQPELFNNDALPHTTYLNSAYHPAPSLNMADDFEPQSHGYEHTMNDLPNRGYDLNPQFIFNAHSMDANLGDSPSDVNGTLSGNLNDHFRGNLAIKEPVVKHETDGSSVTPMNPSMNGSMLSLQQQHRTLPLPNSTGQRARSASRISYDQMARDPDLRLNNAAGPHQNDYARRLESITPSRAQTLLQKLKFGASEILKPISVPPHADILDVADQAHNDKLPYSVRLESFPLRSRVETQIKCRIIIQDKKTGFPPSHSLLYLPSDTIARPRFQLLNAPLLKEDASLEKSTLHLSIDAINPDNMSQQILMCGKCLERERRRAFRKKVMDPHEETYWTGLQDRRIVVFNCRQVMPISATGHTELPLRVACYCRHHAAKNGYQLLFGLRDSQGKLVGRAISPRVFITDSHKDHRKNAESSQAEAAEAASESDVSNGPTTPSFTPSSVDSAIESESESEVASQHSRSSSMHRVSSNASVNRMHPYARPKANQSSNHATSSHASRSAQSSQKVPSWLASVSSDVVSPTGASLGGLNHPSPNQTGALASAGAGALLGSPGVTQPAQVSRIIPPTGSMRGGVEITLLGQGFRSGLVAMFGDLPSISTQFWSDTTIIAHLPPSSQPGPVPVTFKDDDISARASAPLFTYINDGEDKLKELTMQMIGYRMGGNFDEISGMVDRMSAETAALDGTPGDASNNAYMNNGGGQSAHQRASISGEKMALWALHNLPKIAGAQPLNVNLRNDEGQSMAHLAAMLGSAPVLRALMAKNAYLDLQDVSGFTPLHFAVLFDNRNVTRLLLQADADPFNRTSHGLIARDLADGTVVDLLPKDQRAWYSELNRRGSSSSVAEDFAEEMSGRVRGSSPALATPEATTDGTDLEISPYMSPLSTIADTDIRETPRRPPSYSQLYPEVTNRRTGVKMLRSSTEPRRRFSTMRHVIDIDVSASDNEADDEGEDEVNDGEDDQNAATALARVGPSRIEKAQITEALEAPTEDEDSMISKPRPAWMVRWANRDLDVRNDRMLFTFWIPVALMTVLAILMIYTLQHYGTPGAPKWVNSFGDLVSRGLNLAVDHVMPMPRVVPIAKSRQR